MSSDPLERVSQILFELSEHPEEEWERRLRAYRLPKELEDEVRELLSFTHRSDAFDDEDLGAVGRGLIESVNSTIEVQPMPERIGEYTPQRKLGEGGMGIVYEATKQGSNEHVALKVLRFDVAATFGKRFRHEAEILRRLDHPGIAGFIEAGKVSLEDAAGVPFTRHYLAMELVAGEPIHRFVDRRGLSLEQKLELMALVCDAVQHAHERGVIHRDLKPSNILVVPDESDPRRGQPKVLDFGISRAQGNDLATLTLTDPGLVMGTIPYMSPEQLSSDGRRDLDARSDVYSLGVVLFELLSGELPHDIRGLPLPEMARVIRDDEPRRLGSALPRSAVDVEIVLDAALRKNPEHRYASAAELAADLRRIVAHVPIVARRESTTQRLKRYVKRNKVLVVAAALTLLSLTGFMIRESVNRRAADARARAARESNYRTKIEAAAAALDRNRVLEARKHLEEAPAEHIGWEWHYLESLLDQSLNVLHLPEDLVPIPEQLVSDEERGVLRTLAIRRGERAPHGKPERCLTFDLKTGELLESLPATRFSSLSRDGRRLLSCGSTELAMWSLHEEQSYEGLTVDSGNWRVLGTLDPATSLAYRIDGSFCGIVDLTRGRLVQSLATGDTGAYLRATTIDSQGHRVVQTGLEATQCWDLSSNSAPTRLPGSAATVHCLRLGPRGDVLAMSNGDDPRIRTWRYQGGQFEPGPSLYGHLDQVLDIAFDATGELLASASEDYTVRLWAVEEGAAKTVFLGHENKVQSVAFLQDGRRIASAALDGTIRIWATDLPDTNRLKLAEYVYAVDFDPTGRLLFTGSSDGCLGLFDATSGRRLARVFQPGKLSAIHQVEVQPNGSLLALSTGMAGGGGFQAAFVLDRASGGVVRRFEERANRRIRFAFSPDGSRLALHSATDGLQILRVKDWKVLAHRTGLEAPNVWTRMHFDRQGDRLAVSCDDDIVRVLDASSLETIDEIPVSKRGVTDLSFSPDDRHLALALSDGRIRVHSFEEGGSDRILTGHTDRVFAVAFSPDGNRLLSGSGDRTVRLWDTRSWEAIVSFDAHRDYVYSIAIAPDGERFATASGDGTVRIWDARTVAERVRAAEDVEQILFDLKPRLEAELKLNGPESARHELERDETLTAREREIADGWLLGQGLELSNN
ncbi:MAG: serine/threonine-protein kinase [Planctomycetota bacterium]